MARRVAANTVVVIGLGRFGAEVARTLMALGREVLAIERDPALVRQHAPHLTLVVSPLLALLLGRVPAGNGSTPGNGRWSPRTR